MTHLKLSTSTEALPESWIEKILDEMLLSYGKKFIDQWAGVSTDKLIAHWSRELTGYTPNELRKGLDALASKEWPPSLPEFKKMCRPPVDHTAAYYEALAGIQARDKGEIGTWSHPAIYWAAVKIGAFDFNNQTFSQLKARWEKALCDELDKKEWPAIPAAMLALPDVGKAHLSNEEAKKRLNELGASEVLKAKTDHKLWAKRIKEREKRGDKYLTAIQIQFANEALANKEQA